MPDKWLFSPRPPANRKGKVGRPSKVELPATTQATDETQLAADGMVTTVDKITPMDDNETALMVVEATTAADSTTPTSKEINTFHMADKTPQASTSSLLTPHRLRGKYKSFIIIEKRKIVDEAELRGIHATIAAYCIPVSTVVAWKKAYLAGFTSQKRGARSADAGCPLTIGVDNDEHIVKLILKQRELHILVSRHAIQNYARSKFGSARDFHASDGWLQKFMQRHHLSLRCRTSMSQKLPTDVDDKVVLFTKFIKDKRSEDELMRSSSSIWTERQSSSISCQMYGLRGRK